MSKVFERSLDAWHQWKAFPLMKRMDVLRQAIDKLEVSNDILNPLNAYLEQAENYLQKPTMLPGPTGETNELYLVSLGVCLIDTNEEETPLWLLPLFAALISGNSVVIGASKQHQVMLQKLQNIFSQQKLNFLVLTVQDEEWLQLLTSYNIAAVSCLNDSARVKKLARLLADRDGALIRFIYETNLMTYCSQRSHHDLIEFSTEKTRTINITAIGGNASLLELAGKA